VDEKSVVTGITVGKVNGGSIDDVKVSVIGMAIIECMAAQYALNYPGEPIVVAGVPQSVGALDRVRKVLKRAPSGAAILFVCADSKVYDAATPALNVNYGSTRQGIH
jgi:hypothetical protein